MKATPGRLLPPSQLENPPCMFMSDHYPTNVKSSHHSVKWPKSAHLLRTYSCLSERKSFRDDGGLGFQSLLHLQVDCYTHFDLRLPNSSIMADLSKVALLLAIWVVYLRAISPNVTINSTDPLITYFPTTSWIQTRPPGLNWTHAYMATDDSNAYAVITYSCELRIDLSPIKTTYGRFRGVAFTILAMERPYFVATNVTVDNAKSFVVVFQGPGVLFPTPDGGFTTSLVGTTYAFPGKNRQNHTIRVSVPQGNQSTVLEQFL